MNKHQNPQELFNHYVNLSLNNYKNLIDKQDVVNIKSYLFVLKTILMAEYIATNQSLPPLSMPEIFKLQLENNEEIKTIAEKLLEQKINSFKTISINHIEQLDNFG